MIKSYKSKKLKAVADGDFSKVDQRHLTAIRAVMTALDSAEELQDCAISGKRLHPLKQYTPERWSLDVSGNWRVTFEWDGTHVLNVDYEDTH